MPSVAIPVPHPPNPTRRRFVVVGYIHPRRAKLRTCIPIPPARPCVWCGHPVTLTDPVERIGLADVHAYPCAEQFEISAYGEEGNR